MNMKHLFYKYKFFLILALIGLSANTYSFFPDQHTILLNDQDSNTLELLDTALKQSIVRILGSNNEYDKNSLFLKNISTKQYIKQYEFIEDFGKSKIKIIVDSKSLRNYLLENNLSITSEDRQSLSAWILCKAELESKAKFDKTTDKCDQVKSFFIKSAEERNIDLFFPIFDSVDINFLELEQKTEINDIAYLNNRYNSNGSFYCEITFERNNCFNTFDSKKKNTKINFEKRYSPAEIFNKVVDSVQESRKLFINKDSFRPFTVVVKNISSLEDYDLAFKELSKIVLFNDLKISSLDKKDTIFSSNLLGKITELENLFNTANNFEILSIKYKEIVIKFNNI